jgi:DNA (cytosine-5)-methyltransferase 1
MSLTLTDTFAGGGGGAKGAKDGGAQVLMAANHNPLAVEYYSLNHLGVVVRCQDLRQTNFYEWPDSDGGIASPSCKGHTRARGKDEPHHDQERGTAWAVVENLEAKRPGFMVMENVREMLDWLLYPAWEDAVQRLGYSISVNIRDAADYGVPQHRERILLILTQSKHPFELRQVHAPHVPASTILELNRYPWSPVNKPGRSARTMARVTRGRAEVGHTFLMPYYSSGSGLTGRRLDRPLGTVTTKDRWAIVRGDQMRMLHINEYKRAMGFPSSYILPKRKDFAMSLLGDAIPPPMMRDTIEQIRRAA